MEDRWIKECLRQAKRAFDAGEVPVGAVVVKDGKVSQKPITRWRVCGTLLPMRSFWQ
jgi:tRNA-adenosine deaminase (EC 3.5.4.-)